MLVKKTLLILLIISSLVSSNCFAEDKAQLLNKNEAAPYSGILLTLDQMQQLRKNTLERDDLTLINTSLTRQIDLYKTNEGLYNKKVDLLTTQNEKLYQNLYNEQKSSTWEKIGLIGLGFLASSLLSYGIYRAALGQ